MAVSLWIVVPAYNESAVLAQTLAGIIPYASNVVVVDDGSRDDTAAVAKASHCHVVRHPVNLGQGAALQTGIAYALHHGASHICTFDADGQHEPSTIDRMLRDLIDAGADVALGSRFAGAAPDMPRMKRLVLRAAVVMTRVQTGLNVTDTHNGLRLFTARAAASIAIQQNGMAHGSEILSIIAAKKMRIVETPTTVYYTDYSKRKGQKLSNSIKIACDLMYSALTS